MQAFGIVYNDTEERVALGWPGGKLSVHHINPDGSPGELATEVLHHKSTLVFVGWRGDQLVSVSNDGAWAISESATGAVVSSGTIGGEYVHGSLSPSGSSLFLYGYVDGNAQAFRVSCADGSQTPGLDVDDHLSVTSRVFAISDDVALYHLIKDDWDDDTVNEGFVRVDFAAGTAKPVFFATGPTSDFDSETRLMAIDPIRNIGVRPDYQPVEMVEVDGSMRAVLRVEIFDIETLEPRARSIALRWPVEHLGNTSSELATAEPGSEEYLEAQDWFVRMLCSARFVAGTDHVWVSIQRGCVRRLSTTGEDPAAPILHGGGPKTNMTLNDVFARNLVNNYTLGVSPSGRYVGFGNPNDFFCTDDVDLGAERAVKLPERGASGPSTEAPGLVDFAGDHLVVFDRGHRMFLADADGEPERAIELEEYYGDATSVSMSTDGAHLAVAVSGGSAFFYDMAGEELLGLPIPPHTIHAAFADASKLFFVHHNGAVVAMDLEKQALEAHRAGDEGYPEEMLEDMDPEEVAFMKSMAVFEQRYDCYAGVHYRVGDVDWVGAIDENDDLQLYKIADGPVIEEGPEISVGGHQLAAGDGWIAVGSGSKLQILDTGTGKVVEQLSFEGDLRALHTGCSSGALYVFDDRAGQLIRLADPRTGDRDVVFEYQGPSVARVAVSERLDRLALVTASGEIELHQLESGEPIATVRVEPRGGDVRELVRE